jgi:hypothetical protein
VTSAPTYDAAWAALLKVPADRVSAAVVLVEGRKP